MEGTAYLLDDDPGVLDSLMTLMRSHELEARAFLSSEEILATTDWKRPGCIVIDLRLGAADGLTVIEQLRERGVHLPAIMISAHGNVEVAVRAMECGCRDFLQKPYEAGELMARVMESIRDDADQMTVDERVAQAQGRLETLTPRERDVFDALIGGFAGKQIARQLGISYRTMEKHRANVMHKMEASSLVALVRQAVTVGLIPDPHPETADAVQPPEGA